MPGTGPKIMPATTMKTSADMSGRPCSSTISDAYTGNATQPSFSNFSTTISASCGTDVAPVRRCSVKKKSPVLMYWKISHASAMPAMLPAAAMSLWPAAAGFFLAASRTGDAPRAGRNS